MASVIPVILVPSRVGGDTRLLGRFDEAHAKQSMASDQRAH
jgi:hypothetical protein